MINHARTLLMNISPSRADYVDSGYEGYEYIPAAFLPIALPTYLQSIRKVLFGANGDGLFTGMRANELLSYIHDTELAEYVYKLDNRVTYWPYVNDHLYDINRKKILVTQTIGDPRRLIVTGDLQPVISSGTAYRSYVAAIGKETPASSTLTFYVRRLEAPGTVVTAPFVPPNTPVITLPQSTVDVRVAENPLRDVFNQVLTEVGGNIVVEMFNQIGENRLVLETPMNFNVSALQEIVAQWYIIARATPEPAITTVIPLLEMLGEPIFLKLFGVAEVEPYVTFKNLWFDHPLPAYRLAGLVLAVIYRTEELRAKNG
jgi:hypothetical protein